MANRIHKPPHKIAFIVIAIAALIIGFISLLFANLAHMWSQVTIGIGLMLFTTFLAIVFTRTLILLGTSSLSAMQLFVRTSVCILCVAIMMVVPFHIIDLLPFAKESQGVITSYNWCGAVGLLIGAVIAINRFLGQK